MDKVRLEPALPTGASLLILAYDRGATQVFLQWKEAWWPSFDAFWQVNPEDGVFKSTASEWYNLHNYHLKNQSAAPVLLTTPTGYWAKLLEEKTDQEVAGIFQQELQGIFPDRVVPMPEKIYRTNWWTDRFARGSYTSTPVGSDPRDLLYMQLPIGRALLFAGESTSLDRSGKLDDMGGWGT
jgi:monoamine oxidase